MSEYKNIIVEINQAVATVRMHRPANRNALNRALMLELREFATTNANNPSLQCVILTGSDEYFSAGADLSRDSGGHLPSENPTLLERREYVTLGPSMCQAWERMDMVTIAAIEGYAIGGAVALAASCDFRIAAENAKYRLPEIPLGINMSWRSLPRLAGLMGPSKAKYFALFGEWVEGEKLSQWGLADELVPAKQTLQTALKWADKILELPPLPVRMTVEAVDGFTYALQNTSSFMDRDQYLLTATSDDFAEGVRAFFQKRKPDFTGS